MDFIKNDSGSTLSKQGLGNRKLIAWDHNRDLLYQRASVILNDAQAAKYVWGIGFHWYETWTGGAMQFDNVRMVSQAFPGKNLIFTEGCQEKFNLDSVYNWSLGEKYGYSMINDFNNGTVAWTDWNVLLDENFNAKLSDFGLARLGPAEGYTHVSTSVSSFFPWNSH